MSQSAAESQPTLPTPHPAADLTIDFRQLATERRNSNTAQIDRVSTLEMLKLINQEDQQVALAVAQVLPQIAAAVDLIAAQLKLGGRLFYVGAGTSGRLGVLDASECPPTFGVEAGLVVGLIAGGDIALRHPVEGAEDSLEACVQDLQAYEFCSQDVLVGIAASGRTPYVLGGLSYASSLGAHRIAIACSPASPIGALAEIAIEPLPGAEVITGSTRLKAGTAQKLVLNMLSTGAMIKLGKVYGNLMVDVRASNQKLIERCKQILCEVTDLPRPEAEALLEATGYDVKLAILLQKTGLPLEEATQLLQQAEGYLQRAIEQS
ncbi:MAG: N-acetylmuramic acid 6-phosphate etherase [Pegethrix bostrychoides GSE-TBD4-15B]|uniref:N-acetylmuramic acid 6-phosphate etherase n=1 Tax=Pegethrix bostrychoides GSE-TBD4-15B TaxID=2839662 RepID=A0A951U2R5_9CYAN|nr:N-acetylmuramic acid 6-phosphate etherase [Pegethrix bostrychoides GSE-TBD4-15B]